MAGYVVDEHELTGVRAADDTAEVKTTIDERVGCKQLVQRIERFHPGRSSPRTLEGRQEVMYVASGRGTIHIDGKEHALARDTGVYVGAGETYDVENPGPEELVAVIASAPAAATPGPLPRDRAVRYVDQPVLPAGTDREFRFLVTQEVGCADVTQFVGVIPPGRAPDHSHTYDEVVYVVEGEGILHIGEEDTPIGAGSCIHLPPYLEHCLENTGSQPMRVMGVFHPAGDPSSRAYEANQ